MRSFDGATQTRLDARGGYLVHHLFWTTARNFSSGVTESLGLWTGADARQITVDGQVRTYFGAGTILAAPEISAGVGVQVRYLDLELVELTPEVALLLRGYDTRLAPLVVHRVLMDPASGVLTAAPHRVWRGTINEVDISRGPSPRAVVRAASDARRLTVPLPAFYSEATLRSAHPSDMFFRYADVSGQVPTWWGARREPPPRR